MEAWKAEARVLRVLRILCDAAIAERDDVRKRLNDLHTQITTLNKQELALEACRADKLDLTAKIDALTNELKLVTAAKDANWQDCLLAVEQGNQACVERDAARRERDAALKTAEAALETNDAALVAERDAAVASWDEERQRAEREGKRVVKLTAERDGLRGIQRSFPEWLLDKTFCVEYSPNCVRRWLMRLPGKSAVIDKRQYIFKDGMTGDAIGFGPTLEEAANAARATQATLGSTQYQKYPPRPGDRAERFARYEEFCAKNPCPEEPCGFDAYSAWYAKLTAWMESGTTPKIPNDPAEQGLIRPARILDRKRARAFGPDYIPSR
jgi:hypothetical protein